ncbi:sel1 repeat family protein [Acetobacteraceae bacterium]|nr:sel1 repeat family protein [Acetobacteraceae bacterium]
MMRKVQKGRRSPQTYIGTFFLASMLLMAGTNVSAETLEKSARPSLSFFAFFPTFVLPPLIVSIVPSSLVSVVQGKFSKPADDEEAKVAQKEGAAQTTIFQEEASELAASESETPSEETAKPETEKTDETSDTGDSSAETTSEAETESEETAPPESASASSETTEVAEASLEEKAEAGDAEAQYDLGVSYEKGKGVPQNHQKALELLKKSAAQGNEKAKEALEAVAAHSDASGENEAYLPSKEMRAMIHRAEMGDPLSQSLVGFSYEMGKGVTRNHAKAVEWYQKAADQGDEEAKAELKKMKAQKAA